MGGYDREQKSLLVLLLALQSDPYFPDKTEHLTQNNKKNIFLKKYLDSTQLFVLSKALLLAAEVIPAK